MTVSSTATSAGPYTGNGTTTVFPFGFKIASGAEVAVSVNGVVSSTGFTVTRAPGGNGGSVTFSQAPASGAVVVVFSAPSFLQQISLQNNGPFLPESIEEGFDRAAIRDLALKGLLDRSIKVPVGAFVPGGTPEAVADWLVDALMALLPEGFRGERGFPGEVLVAGIPYITAAQFGAIGYTKPAFDLPGLTMIDSRPMIQAAIDSLGYLGGEIRLENKYYRIGAPGLKIPSNVHLKGVAPFPRTRVFGESITPFQNYPWLSYSGTILIVDDGVRAVYFPSRTDVADPADVLANSGATASNPTYWKYATAAGAKMEGVGIYYRATTTFSGVPAIENRARITLERVLVVNAHGPGVLTTASFDGPDGDSKYGNASCSLYQQVYVFFSREQGFKTLGRDANVIKFDTCDASENGGWGFDDNGFLGNSYLNCHSSLNNSRHADWAAAIAGGASAASQPGHASVNYGSFRLSNTNANHVLTGCYVEGANGAGYQMRNSCIVVGGILSSVGIVDNAYGMPTVFGPNGLLKQNALTHYNARPSTSVAVRLGRGDNLPIILSWGDTDGNSALQDGTMTHALQYMPTYKIYSLGAESSTDDHQIAFSTRLTGYPRQAPFFQNGLFLGSPMTGTGTFLGNTTATSGASMPAGLYNVGDDFRMAPVAGGKRFLTVVTAGAKGNPWTSGTTYNASAAPQSASFVESAGKVYRCTGTGPGASTVAPTHTSGSVTGSDGYTWLYLNNNTVPVFKAWGSIDA